MSPTSYFSPGVYIEEVSTLPPSVVEIGTAIPAFIGSTTNHTGSDGVAIVHEISSLREFEDRCGRPASPQWKVVYDSNQKSFTIQDHNNQPVDRFSEPEGLLWYAIDLYFRNGGSRCYIVSVAKATPGSIPTFAQLNAGLQNLESYDEPTLVVIPEAVKLQKDDYGAICQAALTHAARMADRFVLLDAQSNPSSPLNGEEMRTPLGMKNLDRGALYFPHLHTNLSHQIKEAEIGVVDLAEATVSQDPATTGTQTTAKRSSSSTAPPLRTLADLATTQTDSYNQIKQLLANQRVILPPSAAIAGVIASVDRERGVWKAPANVSLQGVIAPALQVTDAQQDKLNSDATTGKSINVIRSFAGKGPMVWGARTLAGNDNEWRYISVRRLFITVEESVKKATYFAVFEANDITLWLKVKGMIDSYLYTLWERGALRGAKSEEAYFVKVGLDKTMSQDDILKGYLIVEIGLAAVRPAEFIVLRFSHKLAQ
jgi:phage tail sheath protein FI